jgi:hypothetical protein
MTEIVKTAIEINMQAYGGHSENATTSPHCYNVHYQDIAGIPSEWNAGEIN